MIFAVAFMLVVFAACGVAVLQLFRGLDRTRAFVASMVLMGAVVGLPGLLFSRALGLVRQSLL